jgi:cell division protein YceG involved in septum cleavage
MKKYVLLLLIIIIVLILAVLSFDYLAPKEAGKTSGESVEIEKTPEKSGKEEIADLLSKRLNQPAETLIIEVKTNTGTFAKGTYNMPEAGGGIWLAAKTAKGWELASAGNGIAPCEDIDKYDFPKDMIPACIDTQNNNNLIQR